ncbi:tRNA-splicing endonuclease subunit Sen54 [Glycine max]|uniref:tRNA-splicing endonuclease subunit Sen54 n=1 Tax=Glycine max TaxID=3847 RepID=UPI0007192B03|nr:tRNA-splicing endonuclease subunit Sen54 [Glycine max]|eukprot:XP_014629732.1 tRNA-splicing endonuclease subunit Sen54 [Glycine max]
MYSMPKLQFRNVKSKGCWNEEVGMGDIIEKNGKMWVTTGIVRSGKIYSSIEETLYLMELGALDLLDNGGRSISLTETYEKVASGKSGCCWELFDVYRHLKSIGYIIGRHGVAWSLKSIKVPINLLLLKSQKEIEQLEDIDSKSELSINELWVYHASSVRVQHPPSRAEIEAHEKQCGGIPLKICRVREGRVNLFSSDKVELPVLP